MPPSRDITLEEEMQTVFEELGFRVDVSPFASCLKAAEGLVLTLPAAKEGSAESLAVAVARSNDRSQLIVNPERFAAKRLNDEVARVLESIEHGEIRIGGLAGFRTLALVESLHPDHEDEERWAAQVVLFGERGYFVIWSELEPENRSAVALFDALARSFVRLGPDHRPLTTETEPPADVREHLRSAFELALEHRSEDATALGERYVRHLAIDEARDPDAAIRARAYGAEAWFLRFNTETLASLIFDRDDSERIEKTLRQRLPGFDEATYREAMAYAEALAEIPESDDD